MGRRQSSSFSCQSCQYKAPKWMGQCPGCTQWHTLAEDTPDVAPTYGPMRTGPAGTGTASRASSVPLHRLGDISLENRPRLLSGLQEWDRVVGGGLMPASFCMLTGDPGIGKSTLLLQIAFALARTCTVMYVSTEESLAQIKQRALRLAGANDHVQCTDHTRLQDIIETAVQQRPDLLIIDSLQNCMLDDLLPGSVSHIKEAAFRLMRLAKEEDITIIMSGHITKDGSMAGPKTLEHLVDAVFYLQGEDQWQTRILRSLKNRFGTSNEIGFFDMHSDGLQEVPNVNNLILQQVIAAPGSVLTSSLEGNRALLLEMQALMVAHTHGHPQRVISGVEYNQVLLLASLLQKYLKVKCDTHDIFFKIAGGSRTKSSSGDLAIVLSLFSSYVHEALPAKTVALAEVSLNGHIKPVPHIDVHLKELSQFQLARVILSKNQYIPAGQVPDSLSICRIGSIYEIPTLFSVS